MLDSTEETEFVSYCNFIYDRFKTSTEPAATAGESNRSRRAPGGDTRKVTAFGHLQRAIVTKTAENEG